MIASTLQISLFFHFMSVCKCLSAIFNNYWCLYVGCDFVFRFYGAHLLLVLLARATYKFLRLCSVSNDVRKETSSLPDVNMQGQHKVTVCWRGTVTCSGQNQCLVVLKKWMLRNRTKVSVNLVKSWMHGSRTKVSMSGRCDCTGIEQKSSFASLIKSWTHGNRSKVSESWISTWLRKDWTNVPVSWRSECTGTVQRSRWSMLFTALRSLSVCWERWSTGRRQEPLRTGQANVQRSGQIHFWLWELQWVWNRYGLLCELKHGLKTEKVGEVCVKMQCQ